MTELTRTASEMFVNTARFLDAYHAVMQPLCTEAKLPPAALDIILYLANNPSYNTAKDICCHKGLKPSIVSFHVAFHNLYQSWAWLGGHADGEEDLLRVALREANEESGIVGARPLRNDIFSLEILGVDGHVKRGRYVATHLHLNCTYLLEADDRLPIRVKADENSAVRWIPFADVEAEVREPEMRVVYRKLMDKAGC